MAIVSKFLVQVADGFELDGARLASQPPPNNGGREKALARTVREMAAAFGRLDTHHECVIEGLRFLASPAAVGRVTLFVPAAMRGGMMGRAKTCGDIAERLAAAASRVNTFGHIPGVLAQSATVWRLVADDAAGRLAAAETEIARRTSALPPAGPSVEQKVAELTAAEMALAGVPFVGPGSERRVEFTLRRDALQREVDVLRGGGSLLSGAPNAAREAEVVSIAAATQALGRDRAMVATWTREAEVLFEASQIARFGDTSQIPAAWSVGPMAVLNTSIETVRGGPACFVSRTITREEATASVSSGFVSHVGHDGTASMLSTLLGASVPMSRSPLAQGVGTHAIVFQMLKRGEEGRIYTAEELGALGYEFRVMTRVA